MAMQENQNVQNNLKKKKKNWSEYLTLLSFKTYHKATETMTLLFIYWVESSEINPAFIIFSFFSFFFFFFCVGTVGIWTQPW
jgi:hypothetical protein